jgi:hypothetical protein
VDRPIGWWVKEVDRLLTEALDAALKDQLLDRTGWQVLNTVATAGRAPRQEVAAALASFADETSVATVVGALAERGWVTDADPVEVTGQGRAAHADLLAAVTQVRRAAVDGIECEDYQTTVRTLAQMVENLSQS